MSVSIRRAVVCLDISFCVALHSLAIHLVLAQPEDLPVHNSISNFK